MTRRKSPRVRTAPDLIASKGTLERWKAEARQAPRGLTTAAAIFPGTAATAEKGGAK